MPVTSGVLVATQQIVECLAIRGTEPKVNPPKSVPQVAEANAEAELTVALRTAFHSTSTDEADFAMPRHRAEEAPYGGAAGELLPKGDRGRAPGTSKP
jgi:hypothetical protein